MKAVQYVRIADVIVIAPLLIYASIKIGVKTPLGIALLVVGILTLIYNSINFVENA